MNDIAMTDDYGVLVEPATLRLQRMLPGPVERVWAYLIESDLRRQWFAAGEMELRAGAPFEWTWRNDELTDPPGQRPDGFSPQHSMECSIVAVDPPHRLVVKFGPHGEVAFTLEPEGDEVLLTLVHSRVPNRETLMKVSAGWHAHLDVLVARTRRTQPEPFWDAVMRLRGEYERRLPG